MTMAEFDLTQNPLENAESLLQQARQTSRRQRRDDTKNMLFNLAGQLVGGIMQGRQQEKYNNFMNRQDVLTERSLVRSAVDKAQRVAERGKAAASYEGGKEAYFRNELFELYKAKLDTELGKDGSYYDKANVTKIADQKASETVAEYIKNFDAQLSAAQNVLTATGGDRLAYGKALREASGVDLGVMGRGMRKLTSYFLDENDRNTDGALYRSTTSSQIYQASKEFQETFDKFYTATGNSLVSTNIAEFVEENKDKILKAQMTYEPSTIQYVDDFGKQRTVSVAKELRSDGSWTGAYVDIFSKKPISSETFKSSTGGSLMDKDDAANVLSMTRQANRQLEDKLDDLVKSYMPEDTDFGDNTTIENAAIATAGTHLAQTNKRLAAVFDDTDISDSRRMSIAARARILDMEAHDGRPTLLNPSAENPFLTYHATIEEYGNIDDVPQGIRDTIESNINAYVNETLPAQSSGRLEEVMQYVENNPDIFSNLNQEEYSLLDVLDFQLRDKLNISQDYRRQTPKEASILGMFRN